MVLIRPVVIALVAMIATLGISAPTFAIPIDNVLTDDAGTTHNTSATLIEIISGGSLYAGDAIVQAGAVTGTNNTGLYGGVASTPPFPASTAAALGDADVVTGKANAVDADVFFSTPITSSSARPDVGLFEVGSATQTDSWTVTAIVGGVPGAPVLGGTPLTFNQNTQFGDTGDNINFRRNLGENLTQDLVGGGLDVTQLGLAEGSTILGVRVQTAGGDPSAIVGLQDSLASGVAVEQFRVGDPTSPNTAAGEYFASPSGNGRLNAPGGNPAPQNPTVAGFAGSWTGDGTSLWQVVEGGLEHGSIGGETGGSAQFQFNSEVGFRTVKRSLSETRTIGNGEAIYMSALIHMNEVDPDFDGQAYIGFTQDNGNTATLESGNGIGGFRIGVAGDGQEMDLVYRSRTRLSPPAGAVSIEDAVVLNGILAGETHLVIVKGEKNTAQPGGFPNDLISIWVDPLDTSSEAALGAPTLQLLDFSLFSNEFQVLTLQGSNITGAGVRFDEARLAFNFEDVIARGEVIPEPTTAVLGLLGIAGLARRRRRAA